MMCEDVPHSPRCMRIYKWSNTDHCMRCLWDIFRVSSRRAHTHEREEFIKYEIAMYATIYHMMNEHAINNRNKNSNSNSTEKKKYTRLTIMSFYFVLRSHVAHRAEQLLFFCRIECFFLVCLFLCSFEMSIWRRTIWAMNNVPKKETKLHIDEGKR